MSGHAKRDQQQSSANEASNEHESPSASRSTSDLSHLGSPFAYTPAPADLIDLWDETDRFFDALGDPTQFIEPDGSPTYKVPDLSKAEVKSTREPISEPRRESPREPTQESPREPTQEPSREPTQESKREPKRESKRVEESPAQSPRVSASSAPPSKPTQPSLTERFTQRQRLESRLIVIAGGKGGAGRSLLAANLSISLSTLSPHSVGLVDLDPICSNLHTYVGLEPILEMPSRTLRGELKPLSEKIPNTEVVITRSGRALCGPYDESLREKVIEEALSHQPHWLVIDAGNTPDIFTLNLFTQASYSLILYTPDPSGVERGHSFLQAALYNQLINQDDESSVIARSLLTADHEGLVSSPNILARSLRHVHAEVCHTLEQRIDRFKPHVIVNMCRTQSDRISVEEICSVLKRKWRINPVSLGSISFHHVAHQSLVERRPLALSFPSASICLDIDKITRTLIKEDHLRELKPQQTSSSLLIEQV